MPRIRTIKPEFWTDSLIVQLPPLARLLFIALWNAADDYGCLRDEPERLAMELMPREDAQEIDGYIQLLIACGRLSLMADADNQTFLQIVKWSDHQKVDKPGKSKLLREGSRKLAISLEARRALATRYGCEPGGECDAACFYCDAPGRVHWFKRRDGRPSSWVYFAGLEIDHVEAEAQGGETKAENFVLACRKCNRSKGTKRWTEFFVVVNGREPSRTLASPRDGSGSGSGSIRSGTRARAKGEQPVSNSGGRALAPDGEKKRQTEIRRRKREVEQISRELAAKS
jgi:HNH endonuclease